MSSASGTLFPTPNYGIVVAPSSCEARLRIDPSLGDSLNSLDDHLHIAEQSGYCFLVNRVVLDYAPRLLHFSTYAIAAFIISIFSWRFPIPRLQLPHKMSLGFGGAVCSWSAQALRLSI